MKAEHQRLYEIAAAQDGILLTSQAVAAGTAPTGIARCLRRAGWSRPHRGAWAEPGRPADLRLRAHQLRRPELIASHGSAAAAHGIVLIRPYGTEFTAPGRARRGPEAVVHDLPVAEEGDHRHRRRAGDRGRTNRLRPAARPPPPDEGVIAADSALGRGLVGRRQVADALAATSRRHGTRAARQALELTDAACGSPAESKARLEIRGAGLRPESQAEVTTARGRTVRLDFLFRAEGLGVEIEGFTWHGSRSAHQNDTARFNELAACRGIRQILRFTRDDVFHRPRLTVRTIQSALDALRAEE
ncbi:hypothetical protein [Streptomyces sp. ISL-11]|uniref:hypothetical protein n=1 Tax=Streptomyces sp. ISL-11 TaxID=2819174 RepID=UPI001BE6E316|nr:hypothetical protein [Streptomyces sp. ISL-11]MBT2385754.1 hypothetical protein [Streptomyces sp. ISL-11]